LTQRMPYFSKRNVTLAFLILETTLVIIGVMRLEPAHILMPISISIALLFIPVFFFSGGIDKRGRKKR
jgi:hypothetical protein